MTATKRPRKPTTSVASILIPTTVPVPSASDDVAALLHLFGRMAADTSVPLDRLDRVQSLYEAAVARRARIAYDTALVAMAPKLPVINKGGTAVIGERGYAFAKWEDVAEKIVAICSAHGFSLTFRVADVIDTNELRITAVLAHTGGHREETGLPFPFDFSDGKNPFHARGSAMSYGKRYMACVILNIITRGEDDDGKATAQAAARAVDPSARSTISDEQVDDLMTMLAGRDRGGFMRLASRECKRQLDSLSDIPTTKFEAVKALLAVNQGNAL